MFVLLAGLLVVSFDIGSELAKNSLMPGSRSEKVMNEALFK